MTNMKRFMLLLTEEMKIRLHVQARMEGRRSANELVRCALHEYFERHRI